jgi:hypothetical protein
LNKLYVYTEATPGVSFAATTLVFQTSAGPISFDSAAGAVALEALIGDALLVERSSSPEWSRGDPSATLRFVRWHASRGVVALSSPSDRLQKELDRADLAKNRRKANAVRERLGRPTVTVDPGFFDEWVVDRRLTNDALARLVLEASIVSIWCHGEWGIYARVHAGDDRNLLTWLRRAEHQDTTLVTCNASNELPVW